MSKKPTRGKKFSVHMPRDPTLYPLCKKCLVNNYNRRGDLCIRCYEENEARKAERVSNGTADPLYDCPMCKCKMTTKYKESDRGPVCTFCYNKYKDEFQWTYDEKLDISKILTQKKEPKDMRKRHLRCAKCQEVFVDFAISSITLCSKCFVYTKPTAPVQPPIIMPAVLEADLSSEPPMKKSRSRKTPAKKSVRTEANNHIEAPTNPRNGPHAPNFNNINNPTDIPPVIDNSFDWYSLPPPLEYHGGQSQPYQPSVQPYQQPEAPPLQHYQNPTSLYQQQEAVGYQDLEAQPPAHQQHPPPPYYEPFQAPYHHQEHQNCPVPHHESQMPYQQPQGAQVYQHHQTPPPPIPNQNQFQPNYGYQYHTEHIFDNRQHSVHPTWNQNYSQHENYNYGYQN
ncbi:Protein CBG27820 [Caenorhabditis briggsae]|uniref:Uncharacterized protein n=3 Tax=Caenorhabditis briggsae TaxID=6238 RepID=A0AAE8ZP91_CAEBR|nr:Protein CBG27820 [Caenorhabditis briggsae]ULT83220.1 hypothetical protein L3Y34_012453 [Caenorhabditis briggsae]CAS00332.1 Protein CBG27820 [Caenorhabditis briggsae]